MKKEKYQNKRINIYNYIIYVMFIILTSRLVFLQIIKGEYYSLEAEAVFSRVYKLKSPRGEILARNGEKLAISKQGFNIVYIDNRKIVPESKIPTILLKTIRVIKNNTNDYDKLILDRLPIEVEDSNVKFSFTIYTENNDEEEFKKIYRLKEERFKKDYNIPLEYNAQETLYELMKKYNLLKKVNNEYKYVENMTLKEARDVLALLILIDKQKFNRYKPTSIANNVSRQTAFYLASISSELPNITFIEEPIRYYPNGDFASHVIGALKRIDETDIEKYRSLGYDVNSELVGAMGLESSLENLNTNSYRASLRGEPQERYITVDKYGNQLKLIGEVEGIAGDTIITTIDYRLQKVAEKSLENLLADLQQGKADGTKRPLANRGAVVVVDVRTGEILALASKPSFDPNLFAETGTIKDEETRLRLMIPSKFISEEQKEIAKRFDIVAKPLYNYATSSAIAPGSTFKLFTSIVALEEGVITPNTTIIDKGIYTDLPGYKGYCWIYRQQHSTHGVVNIIKALQESCNYFYFSVAHKMGWEKFTNWLVKYGLINNEENPRNIYTGIEIGEVPNTASNPQKLRENNINVYISQVEQKLKLTKDDVLLSEIKSMFIQGNFDETKLKGMSESQKSYLRSLYKQFNTNEVTIAKLLNASIGQGETELTPLQIAQFYMTVVNGGTRYKLHLVKEILNPDGSLKTKIEPEVINKIEISQETYKTVIEGLKKVSEEGSAASIFGKNYPIENGGKTGTAEVIGQETKDRDILQNKGVWPNGWFVGVAPISNPEIVVVALVFNTDHGYLSARVVKDIYDEYFGLNKQTQTQEQPKQ